MVAQKVEGKTIREAKTLTVDEIAAFRGRRSVFTAEEANRMFATIEQQREQIEKLARTTRAKYSGFSFHEDIMALCDHILSGSYKREIENAAYIHAANRCSNGRVGKWCAAQIRALIQPPAKKENE